MLQPEMRSSIGRKAGEGMTQTHVPYGYRIEDGKALADEAAAEKLKSFFFNEYLVCGSMLAAAKSVGIEKTHSMLGRMLKNRPILVLTFTRGLLMMTLSRRYRNFGEKLQGNWDASMNTSQRRQNRKSCDLKWER